MQAKKIQQLLFSTLLVLSVSSTLYLNDQAKELKSQGFEISYFSVEEAEAMMPDVRFIDHFIDKFLSSL